MKKKIVGILFLFSLASLGFMPNMAISVSTPQAAAGSSYNDIVIDGLIGADWMDGNYTVRTDPDGGPWGEYWHADNLYAAVNLTGFALGYETTVAGPGGNKYPVYIDIDKGGEGLDDFSKSSLGIDDKFASDAFIPDFVLIVTHVNEDETSFDNDFMLYELTDNAGTSVDLSSAPDYVAYSANHSYWAPAWDNPIPMHHEAFIPWDVLYPTGLPVNAEIRLYSSGLGDPIPGADGYVAVQVSDGAGDPELVPYTIDWPGQNGDGTYTSASVNDKDGNVTLALPMSFYYEMYYTGGMTEYMNNSQWPILNIKYYNSTADANTSIMEYMMYHETGDLAGSNEIYRYDIPLLPEDGYAVGDLFWWYITAGDINDTVAQMYYEVENGISAMPPIELGFIGAVTPAGGFILPDTTLELEVQVEQLWNGTDKVTFDVLTNVYVNYTLNATDIWAQSDLDYDEPSSDNAIFDGSIGGFPNGTTVTFYIVAENNNTVLTGPYLINIGIEPPKTEVFYMMDPEGDEWGTYPTNPAFGPGVGLFDIVEFNVSANAFGTQFDIRLLDSYDPGWGGGNFSHQMFVVLVDFEAGGTTESVLAANVETQTGWDVGFYADNWVKRYFTPATIAEPQTAGTGITSGYEHNGDGEHWFNFYVPETLFNSVANGTWTYYVMSASSDFNNYRNHMAENGEWNFGGGDDGAYDPNYCDILVPAGGDSAAVQEFISTSYDVGNQEYAKMLAVGPGLVYIEDTTDPIVTITSPANETAYEWTMENELIVELNWTATDPVAGTFNGLGGVKVYVNGILDPEAAGETANISLSHGENIVRVVATDISGNIGLDEITLYVNDTRPMIAFTTIETSYILDPTLTTHGLDVNWAASDYFGADVSWVYVYLNEVLDETLAGTVTGTTLTLPLGDHTVTLRAEDTLGSWAEATMVFSIIEDEIPPVFDITTSTALYTLESEGGNMTISVAFTASDNYREDMLRYKVYLDDMMIEEVMTSPVEVLEVGVGAHDVTIIAYDYYNNTATDTYLFTIEDPATTEPTTEPTDDPSIPGFSTGFLLIAMVATAGLLIRKRK